MEMTPPGVGQNYVPRISFLWSWSVGNKSAHQIEKFKNKKGPFLDQYVRDSSENLRASLCYVEKTLEGVESSRNQGPFAKSDRQ